MRSLILPESISALNENNDELENTSPYCTNYAFEPSLIKSTSAACVPALACVAFITYLIPLLAIALDDNTWSAVVAEKVDWVKNPCTKFAAEVIATIVTKSPFIAFSDKVTVELLVAV